MSTVECPKCGQPMEAGDTVKLRIAPNPATTAQRCPRCSAPRTEGKIGDTVKLQALDQTVTVAIL